MLEGVVEWWSEGDGMERAIFVLVAICVVVVIFGFWQLGAAVIAEAKIPKTSRIVASKVETHDSALLPQSIVNSNGTVGTILIPHQTTEHLLIATTGEVCPVPSRFWATVEKGEEVTCKWRRVK